MTNFLNAHSETSGLARRFSGLGRRLSFVLAMVGIGGCASYYRPPEGDQYAELRIQNHSGSPIALQTYEDGENCRGLQFIETRLDRPWGSTNNMLPAGETLALRVPADRSMTVSLEGRGKGDLPNQFMSCEVLGTFIPRMHTSYTIEYREKKSDSTCTMQIRRRDFRLTGPEEVPEPLARQRKRVASLANGGSSCL
jgi:hypothetical protein